MQLKTKVIVSGVSNLHDARYCAGMGVDMIAFPINPSEPAFVNEADFKEIVEWLSGPKFFAEASDLAGIELSNYPIEGLLTDNLDLIGKIEAPLILKVTSLADAPQILGRYSNLVEAFLLDIEENELNDTTKNQLLDLTKKYAIYLGSGIDKDNVNTLLEELKPLGIGLKGSKEIKVGFNDFDGLADVLEEIEVY